MRNERNFVYHAGAAGLKKTLYNPHRYIQRLVANQVYSRLRNHYPNRGISQIGNISKSVSLAEKLTELSERTGRSVNALKQQFFRLQATLMKCIKHRLELD